MVSVGCSGGLLFMRWVTLAETLVDIVVRQCKN
jgi:hypothetical protein